MSYQATLNKYLQVIVGKKLEKLKKPATKKPAAKKTK